MATVRLSNRSHRRGGHPYFTHRWNKTAYMKRAANLLNRIADLKDKRLGFMHYEDRLRKAASGSFTNGTQNFFRGVETAISRAENRPQFLKDFHAENERVGGHYWFTHRWNKRKYMNTASHLLADLKRYQTEVLSYT